MARARKRANRDIRRQLKHSPTAWAQAWVFDIWVGISDDHMLNYQPYHPLRFNLLTKRLSIP